MSPLRTPVVRNEETRALERSRDLPNTRTGGDVESLKRGFAEHLQYSQGKDEHTVTALDRYFAAAYTARDRMMRRWIQTQQAYYKQDAKRVYYLSLEFLIGRMLENNLINLGLHENRQDRAGRPGSRPGRPAGAEPDAGLGNGGLGRLAACFLDSMATLALPAYGYGIRYEYGIFDQEIGNGYQIGAARRLAALRLPLGDAAARVHRARSSFDGPHRARPRRARPAARCTGSTADQVIGMAYDVPDPRLRPNGAVNTLRLWRGPRRPGVRPRRLQRRRLPARRRGARPLARTSPRSSTRTT